MKAIGIVALVLCIVYAGAMQINEIKKKSVMLDEIIRFIHFLRTEMNYKATDFYTLCRKAEEKEYKYISFEENVCLNRCTIGEINNAFSEFVSNIGTTDNQGQIELCDVYIYQFSEMAQKSKNNERGKIRVSAAISVLCAVSVVIFFC